MESIAFSSNPSILSSRKFLKMCVTGVKPNCSEISRLGENWKHNYWRVILHQCTLTINAIRKDDKNNVHVNTMFIKLHQTVHFWNNNECFSISIILWNGSSYIQITYKLSLKAEVLPMPYSMLYTFLTIKNI